MQLPHGNNNNKSRDYKMNTYYKYISENTSFAKIAKIRRIDDLEKIPYGAVFTAYPLWEPSDVTIQSKQPVLHFCDNAFDSMLWFSIFDTSQQNYFYRIIPLTEVIKQRCADKYQLFQCGANQIEFRNQIDKYKMFNMAISEYEQSPDEKEKLYPNLDIPEIIKSWKIYKKPVHLLTR